MSKTTKWILGIGALAILATIAGVHLYAGVAFADILGAIFFIIMVIFGLGMIGIMAGLAAAQF